MSLTTEFVPLELGELRRQAAVLKADGWRFIQTHAVNTDDGVDLYYSFMKDGHIASYRVESVQKGTPVPSITDLFLAAFVFENEARELFGVDMHDIALDFQGAMYAPAESEPMTFITPEQKAAREKALKAAQAKAAKGADATAVDAAGAEASPAPQAQATGKRLFVMTPELQARLDAKYPLLSDEKKAKVDAALAARKAEAEAAQGGDVAAETTVQAKEESAAPEATASSPVAKPPVDDAPSIAGGIDRELEQKIAAMDPVKAAIVRAALSGEPVQPAQPTQPEETDAPKNADKQVAALLGFMDEKKAAVVRAALARKGGE